MKISLRSFLRDSHSVLVGTFIAAALSVANVSTNATAQDGTTDEPVVVNDVTVVETPVAETPVAESPVAESPVVETPVVETPAVETPVVETPVAETPVAETPVAESPVVETPVVETPVEETPVLEPTSPEWALAPVIPAEDLEPRPLSVAPLDHAQYKTAPPAWVDASAELDGAVSVWPVKSLRCDSREAAAESLRVQVRGAVAAYAEYFLGDDRAQVLGDSPLLNINIDDLPSQDRYHGTAEMGGQLVFEEAARLRFDETFRRKLASAWQQREVEHRLSAVGVAGGAGLCLLLAGTGIVRRISRVKRPSVSA